MLGQKLLQKQYISKHLICNWERIPSHLPSRCVLTSAHKSFTPPPNLKCIPPPLTCMNFIYSLLSSTIYRVTCIKSIDTPYVYLTWTADTHTLPDSGTNLNWSTSYRIYTLHGVYTLDLRRDGADTAKLFTTITV